MIKTCCTDPSYWDKGRKMKVNFYLVAFYQFKRRLMVVISNKLTRYYKEILQAEHYECSAGNISPNRIC
jgi:hypothetical protein